MPTGVDLVDTAVRAYLLEVASIAQLPNDGRAWWKQNHQRHTLVASVARKALTFVRSQAAAERLFSYSGLIATPMRASLSDASVESNALLHDKYASLKM